MSEHKTHSKKNSCMDQCGAWYDNTIHSWKHENGQTVTLFPV